MTTHSSEFHAWAARRPGEPLTPFTYDPGPLLPDEVQIKVKYCGLCHSDISMHHNHWGMTAYPFVPGHEVVGTVEAVGKNVRGLSIGRRVGLGWFSGSCMYCTFCMSGEHHLCSEVEQTVVGRYGGFADRVRCKAEWAIALPEALPFKAAGPLFCAGITVFSPIVSADVKPYDRVAVIGIGGLGHLAVQFLAKWGCEVTAFTSSPAKKAETLKELGAHHVVNSLDSAAIQREAGKFDFILNTANVEMDWGSYLYCLAPKGRFHTVGAVPAPMEVPAFALITGQRSIGGSPVGSPALTAKMLEFCARHRILPVTEIFDMRDVNQAMTHLRSGKAHYRIALKADEGSRGVI